MRGKAHALEAGASLTYSYRGQDEQMEENGDREEKEDEVKGEDRQKCTRHFRASCRQSEQHGVYYDAVLCWEDVGSVILRVVIHQHDKCALINLNHSIYVLYQL